MDAPPHRPPFARSLSARVLLLAIAFVLLGEILIYVPSIARFRVAYLEERIASAHLATLTLYANPSGRIDPALEATLLKHAQVQSVTMRRDRVERMLGKMTPVAAVFDLDATSAMAPFAIWTLIADSFDTLTQTAPREIRVFATSPMDPDTIVDITLDEGPLRAAMLDYSLRIVTLSVVLSLLVALFLFVSLRRLMVRPLQRMTAQLGRFSAHPEDASQDTPPSDRSDEVGIVERSLAQMQVQLREALVQQTRLAALGAAVGKINHDLRNLLTSAVLLSDRLARNPDPMVRQVAERLIEAMERATRLCSDTLAYARTGEVTPRLRLLPLADLVDRVGEAATAGIAGVVWQNYIPARVMVTADPDQLFRVVLNLGRNAAQAMRDSGGMVRVTARIREREAEIDVTDDGPGIPDMVRNSLFQPFVTVGKSEGSGLGLAICREIMRAHGGDVALVSSGRGGTVFRLTLPQRQPRRSDGEVET